MSCRAALLTPPAPGAIAIIALEGDVEPVLAGLTGRAAWPIGRLVHAPFGDIDDGLAARLDATTAQVMPHGGPRVVELVLGRLAALGAEPVPATDLPAAARFPEARSAAEAERLALLARAWSPLAVDALLAPSAQPDGAPAPLPDWVRHLVDPPLVVTVGAPDVGKSTLANALLGRTAAIAHAGPGTTRDAVFARLDCGGLVVDWLDTPGLRATDDPIEARAIELAAGLVERADLLIAVTDHAAPWPALPRPADLRVQTKGDLERRAGAGSDEVPDLVVSGATGAGLAALVARVRAAFVPWPERSDGHA